MKFYAIPLPICVCDSFLWKKLLRSVYQSSVLYTIQKHEMESVFTFCFPAQPITVHAEILCNREESQNI